MTAAALLEELREAGVRLSVRGDKLRLESKPGAVTADLRERLANAKPELVAVLRTAEMATRARLLRLAEADGLPLDLVQRLPLEDGAACVGLPDNTLSAYLRALHRGQRMGAGAVPEEWHSVAKCDGCGPVYWHRAERLKACPWCFRRRARKVIPRPMVRCGECRHYAPDPLNPPAGVGTCAAGHAARWPMQPYRCHDMRPP